MDLTPGCTRAQAALTDDEELPSDRKGNASNVAKRDI